MLPLTKTAADIFAPTTAGGAPRGADMADAQTWGTEVESLLDAVSTSGGALVFQTKAEIDLALSHAANAMGWVMSDPLAANNGVYKKSGSTGSGSWTRIADLPYSWIRMTDVGAGTDNAKQVTSTIAVSASALRVANVSVTNTGNVTVSENGEAAKPLLTASGTQITSGGLIAGMMVLYLDAGSDYRLLSDQASAAIALAAESAAADAEDAAERAESAAASVEYPVSYAAQSLTNSQKDQVLTNLGLAAPRGHISGLKIANNSTDATNDIDIAPGEAASDDTLPRMIRLTSSITKRLDAAWAVGSGEGGLDTGSVANGTYHLWLIQRSDTGVVDVLFSLSATSPTMPSDYDRKAYLWPIVRSGGSILGFTQYGTQFLLDSFVTPYSSTGTRASSPLGLSVPTGFPVRALVRAGVIASAGNIVALESDDFDCRTNPNSNPTYLYYDQVTQTNSSGQINFAVSISPHGTIPCTLQTKGWIFDRAVLP